MLNINNKIKCLECGNYYKSIVFSHLKNCCGLTMKQYRIKYPNAIIENKTDEHKQKISKTMIDREISKGENNPMFGKFGKEHGAYGNKHSEEFKEQMSENYMGEGNPFFGKSHSEEYINYRKSLKGEKSSFFGKTHSEENKKLIGIKSRERIIEKFGSFEYFKPNYSYASNKFFHMLNYAFGWNGVYAENGDEYCVKDLKYYLDYYEKDNKIIIEYDEQYHNNQKEKDSVRQERIESKLKPELFLRFEDKYMNYEPSLLSQFACGII